MPVRVTPEQFAEKHARRLKASSQDIRAGIERVTVSPTAKAAEQGEKMVARLSESVRSGKWARGLRRVSLEEWKDKTINKGLARIPAGIDAAHDKVVSFATDLIAHENRLLTKIEGMPDLTLDDSIQRATEWMRGMAEFKRS